MQLSSLQYLGSGFSLFASLHSSSPTNHVICPLASIYSQTYHDHAADDYLFPENPRYAMLSSCCYDYIHDIQIPVLYVSMFQQKYDDLILDSHENASEDYIFTRNHKVDRKREIHTEKMYGTVVVNGK